MTNALRRRALACSDGVETVKWKGLTVAVAGFFRRIRQLQCKAFLTLSTVPARFHWPFRSLPCRQFPWFPSIRPPY